MKRTLVFVAVLMMLVAFPSVSAKGAKTASAKIESCTDARIEGKAKLREADSSEGVKMVSIELSVRGQPAGEHAVHIHEVGTCTPCGSAKGHFDPGPNSNSNPDGNHPFHMGDLENIRVNEGGKGHLRVSTTRITLSDGPLSVFDEDGSAFIIHVDPDTYCPEGVEKGCAGGARAACGIITSDSDRGDSKDREKN